MLHGIGCGDMAAALADGHHQLYLMVQVFREGGVRKGDGSIAGGDQHRIGRLHEEEGRLAPGKTHFLGMVLVIASHAVDAVHRKGLGAARDGH